jgi:hypothetical protein
VELATRLLVKLGDIAAKPAGLFHFRNRQASIQLNKTCG